jgi:origin recognition complex subunit 4
LQRLFYQTKSVQEFFAASTLPILALSANTLPTGKIFVQDALSAPESKLQMLEGLSALELSLLIAAARLNIILDQDNCNFNMVFEEYQKMATRARIQSLASGVAATGGGSKVWSRQLSLGAWERLGDYELIIPATGTLTLSGAGTRDVSQDGRVFKVDVALEEILPSVQGMSAVMSKWCREI